MISIFTNAESFERFFQRTLIMIIILLAIGSIGGLIYLIKLIF